MKKNRKESGIQDASETQVNQLISKITILNSISIISSLLSMTIYLFSHIITAVNIDLAVTAICVLLATDQKHCKIYNKIHKFCKYNIYL